jgi:hypothetical protein
MGATTCITRLMGGVNLSPMTVGLLPRFYISWQPDRLLDSGVKPPLRW